MDATKAEDPRAKSNRYSKNARIKFDKDHFDFLNTQFLIDANYVGEPPHVQVSIDNLNDNIDENFLRRDLAKLGRIRTLEIIRHPDTRQHLGLAKVQFEDVKVARACVDSFNGKHVMGRQLSVFKDVRFAIIEKIKEDKLNPKPSLNIVPSSLVPSLMKVVPPALSVGPAAIAPPVIAPGVPPGANPPLGLLPFHTHLQQQHKLKPPHLNSPLSVPGAASISDYGSLATPGSMVSSLSSDTPSASRGRLEDRIAILMKQPNCVLSTIVSPAVPQQPAQTSPNNYAGGAFSVSADYGHPPTGPTTPLAGPFNNSIPKPSDNNKSRSSLDLHHDHHSHHHHLPQHHHHSHHRDHPHHHHHSQHHPQHIDHHRHSRSDRDDHYHNNNSSSSRLHNNRSDSYSDPNSDDEQHTSRRPLKIKLTERQIEEEVLPYCYAEFYKELSANLLSTLFKMLKEKHGYECLEKAQQAHKENQDKLKIQREKERLKLEQEKLFERRYMSKTRAVERPTEAPRPRVNLIRQRTSDNGIVQDKRRHGDADLRRVNRSSAYEPERRGSHNTSANSDYSDNESSSRSSSRSGDSYSDSSRSSRSYSTSGSSSSSTSSSRSSSPSSPVSRRSRSPSSSSDDSDEEYKVKLTTRKPPKPHVEKLTSEVERHDVELDAAEALVNLGTRSLDNQISTEPTDEVVKKPQKVATKKRKAPSKDVTSVASEYRAAKRFAKDITASDVLPIHDENIENTVDENLEDDRMEPRFMYSMRSDKEKQRMLYDLSGTLSEEDVKFLNLVHQKAQLSTTNEVQIPFGSEIANKAHLNVRKSMIDGKAAGHPKWWTGCSRCDVIVVSEKEKVQEEEMNYDDLTKAPIKSHVIQAATSSRRDQRGDQRRIAVLNPNIDDKLIKMYTTSTLQMRAKNLRFSRSKIHKWGLFACEKIANGDAVIEYVGEKIRPSLADHREKVVYTNLPTHDGSSYFFRVDYDVIDATLKGNKARFINHSCNPNCFAKVIKHDNGTNSIVIYAKQVIQEDEEITYDYKFPREENEEKIRCNCRAPNCQKYLN